MALITTLFLASNYALYITVPAEKLKETNAPALVSRVFLFSLYIIGEFKLQSK
jgi:hypothetical protein